MPWSTPGTIGLSTSVTTAIRIVVGLTPISVALFEFAAFDPATAGTAAPTVSDTASSATNADVPHLPLRHVIPPGRK